MARKIFFSPPFLRTLKFSVFKIGFVLLKKDFNLVLIGLFLNLVLGLEIIQLILIIILKSFIMGKLEFSLEIPSGYKNLLESVFENRDEILSGYFQKFLNSSELFFGVDVIERVDSILSQLGSVFETVLRKGYGIGVERTPISQMATEMDLSLQRVIQLSLHSLKHFREKEELLFLSLPVSEAVISATPIEDLDISIRAFNILRSHGIKTIEELVGYKKIDLLKFRHMGKRSLDEIVSILKERNLELKQ